MRGLSGFGWKPLLALAIGVVSFMLLIYFYLLQRHFEHNYKEVQGYFHTVDRSYHRLNYQILLTSLFAYSNQDKITGEFSNLEQDFKILRALPFLQHKQYEKTREAIKMFGKALVQYEAEINDFMMLNAGIKNSFVFITSLSANKIQLFEDHPKSFSRLLSIIADVSQARKLSDSAFLKGLEMKALPLGQIEGMSAEQASLIRSLMLHIHFIAQNYPDFVKTVNSIENSPLHQQLESMESTFFNEAQSDYVLLDRFVIALLTMFLVALTLVVGLLLRTGIENRRLRDLEARLRHSLSHDQLTGLLSRSRFETLLDSFEAPMLILLNIDQFKHVNDFYGSPAGNAILKAMALLIQQPVLEPYNPRYFRLGGDDFGIVLEGIDTERARQFSVMLKQSIESYAFTYEDIEVFITVSIAINCTEPLLENADLALEHEKVRHSEGVVLFSEVLHLKEKAKMNIAMTHEIKGALDRDAILPWFQPIVDLRTGETVKYEALVRLRTAEGVISGPDSFLAAAKQTPYYRRITEVMLSKVFEEIGAHPYRFSINPSMRDLVDEKLVAMLLNLLENNTERAERLDIELLESEELDDLNAVRSFIAKVHACGSQIAIDDFGMGFSNFAYISDLDIDVLKIDGSLITKIASDAKTRNTVATIVRFAQQLGLKVVAEFVENEETVNVLQAMGVEYAQGYYYGRPSAAILPLKRPQEEVE